MSATNVWSSEIGPGEQPGFQGVVGKTEEDILRPFVEGRKSSDEPEALMDGKLTQEMEAKLVELVLEFERESYPTWRFLNRDFLESESFYKDLQSGFYDHRFDVWRVPSIRDLAGLGEAGQRFDFSTNIYKSFGWALISVIGQKVPTTRFLPQDWRKNGDVIAARAASDVAPIIERANKVNNLHIRAAYLLYTHGICGGYVRYLEDGDRYGWKEEESHALMQVKMNEEGYECPGCFTFSPQHQIAPSSPVSGQAPGCPICSRPLSEENFRPAEYINVPVVSETRLVPRGKEKISIHSGLEMRLPPWESEQEDCPYLGLVNEVHVSSLKATYGKRARNLQGGYGAGPYDTWDRFARLALIEPTVSYYSTSNQNLVTFKRYWLRPSALTMIADEGMRDELQTLFPDGIYLAFADTRNLLDAKNERMDDHWRLCRALPGPGMFTPSLGSSVISVQKRYNVLHNFIMEWVEYAAAGQGTFVNSNLISVRALRNNRKAPGMIYPIRVGPGQPIGNAIYESRPGQIAAEIFKYANDLQDLGQLLSGAVPTVSGGTEQSLKPTTYLADREQALGRLYVPWLNLRTFWSEVMLLAIKEFGRWRTEDERYSIFGLRGQVEGREIRLSDLDGNFDAYPEASEAFPVLWHQMAATYMQLMQSQNPIIQGVVTALPNLEWSKSMLGLPDLFVPGADDRFKQQTEIGLLVMGQPSMLPNPQTGMMMMHPSIPIDPFADNHQVHIDEIKMWAVSPAGLKTKMENPAAYANVIAHGAAHQQAIQEQMMAQQMPQIAGAEAEQSEQAAMAGGGAAPGGGEEEPPLPGSEEGEMGGAEGSMIPRQAFAAKSKLTNEIATSDTSAMGE